jgi:hypothetical protein
MAALSDALLVVAMLGYLVAMICYAAVYAFGDKGVVARVASRERELVGAGGPPAVEVIEEVAKPRAGRDSWASRIAAAVLVLAGAAQIGSLIFRGVAGDRLPWGNMYEYVLAATSVAAVAWTARRCATSASTSR